MNATATLPRADLVTPSGRLCHVGRVRFVADGSEFAEGARDFDSNARYRRARGITSLFFHRLEAILPPTLEGEYLSHF
ncbi:hypothetical protein [Natrinema ejinorense]|uniref:Uncharacterized protein n=1 Tax=Natrinema ejinorense TaxID=373386 RepID=A0A2A5R005_9EURY|nr:hypothetical protein [Natrinema ejinorense]PCR92384.1 hypothetical protein CP557_18750 [Natrinema ejinorense]